MTRESFIIRRSYFEPMKKLGKVERGQLLDAICEYALNGIEPVGLSPIAAMAFNFIGPGIERDYLTYEMKAEKNRENGKLGGRPSKKQEEPKIPHGLTVKSEKTIETLSVSDSVSDSDIKKKKTKIFNPPSLIEFQSYFRENGFSKELALRAFKGYDVAGWKDSKGVLVKSWKQKCQHVWFKPENKPPTEKPINGYKLRTENAL
jgi:hypothetical protein